MDKSKNKVKLTASLRNTAYILRLIFKTAPWYLIGRVIMGLVTGLKHGAEILLISAVLNAIDRGESFESIVKIIVIMAVFWLCYYIFFHLYWGQMNARTRLRFQHKLQKTFFEKSSKLDLSSYDSPEFYNDFVYSMKNADAVMVRTTDALGDLVRSITGSASVFAVLFTLDPIVAYVVCGTAVLTMIFRRCMNHVAYKYNKLLNEQYRKEWYIDRFFNTPDFTKEIRLTNVSDNMLKEYDNKIEASRKLNAKWQRTNLIFNTLILLIGCVSEVFVIGYMAKNLYDGLILVGGFAITINSMWKLNYMISDITNQLVNVNRHSLYVEKIRTFMNTKANIVSGTRIPEAFESLEFKNVSFAYRDDLVLKNVSFKINKGERVAIVGYNGAGKTTLTKLIMRLYDVTEGEILYNGYNIKEYDLELLRKKIGAVFQDYRIFAASVAENVLADLYTDDKEELVIKSLESSTFGDRLKTLEKGIHTQLTREFYQDGTDLSGGEAQKVAIARVFAHNNELIIMDEPSSALDPMAEYELNKSISENAKGKTAIFISHRLSTTRHSDRIFMFEGGVLTESGSHEELMKNNKNYAKMFNIQAKNYCVS
ncbi:MAG: ABC transporter ATP-binding protein [Clostridia bacterium]|nr:ABC transporter ATP-binding protein [Clostridia bacterium]